jgi:hypothetical protein
MKYLKKQLVQGIKKFHGEKSNFLGEQRIFLKKRPEFLGRKAPSPRR